jgi:hypothetical protein
MNERKEIETWRKMLEEEDKRRKRILKKILEEFGYISVSEKDLQDWLDVIDEFNERVENSE